MRRPPGFEEKGKEGWVVCPDDEGSTPVVEHLESRLYSALAQCGVDDWVLDSGATHHISPHRSRLYNVLTLVLPITFRTAGGARMLCTEKGDMEIKLPSGRLAVLQDIHILAGASLNLLFARQMAKKGWFVAISEV